MDYQETHKALSNLVKGKCDYELGDCAFGHYGLLFDVEGRHYIIVKNDNGLVDWSSFDTTDNALKAWNKLEKEYSAIKEQ